MKDIHNHLVCYLNIYKYLQGVLASPAVDVAAGRLLDPQGWKLCGLRIRYCAHFVSEMWVVRLLYLKDMMA